jgi:hypothetical protein
MDEVCRIHEGQIAGRRGARHAVYRLGIHKGFVDKDMLAGGDRRQRNLFLRDGRNRHIDRIDIAAGQQGRKAFDGRRAGPPDDEGLRPRLPPAGAPAIALAIMPVPTMPNPNAVISLASRLAARRRLSP